MTVEQHQRVGRSEILSVRQGLLAGLLGGLVMAATAAVGSAMLNGTPWLPINAPGAFFTGVDPVPAGFSGALTWLGLGAMLALGSLLGALYATAQEPVDTPSLLVIALYYGGLTWFISSFLVLSWLNPAVQDVWRTWPVLAGSLAYGLVLGAVAALRNPGTGPRKA